MLGLHHAKLSLIYKGLENIFKFSHMDAVSVFPSLCSSLFCGMQYDAWSEQKKFCFMNYSSIVQNHFEKL